MGALSLTIFDNTIQLWGFWTKCYQNCTQCREIHSVEPFDIGIAILQYVSEWQWDKVDWSGKNADFFDFNWLPWQRP